jgi:hypothetical protein
VNTPVRVAAFAAGLAAVFGIAWAAGAAVGTVADEPEAMVGEHGHADEPEPAVTELPGGLAAAQDGYRLVLADGALRPGTRELAFTIEGPDGAPVTAYDVAHEKQLHLIVVRRDFAGFQHVHPTLDPTTGEWATDVDLTPGAWRVFADFVPTGGPDLTLGSDLAVPGPVDAPVPVAETRVDEVDGYTVTVDGDLESGEHTMLTLRVSRDGEPVTDLEQYLGAAGHLVALREGDLAYLHVHPGEGLEFGAEVPSPGTYHLFLDFQHDGVVRTAELVLEAS